MKRHGWSAEDMVRAQPKRAASTRPAKPDWPLLLGIGAYAALFAAGVMWAVGAL